MVGRCTAIFVGARSVSFHTNMSSPRLDAPGRCALAGDSNVASRVVGAASAPGPKHDDTAGSIRVVSPHVGRRGAIGAPDAISSTTELKIFAAEAMSP